MTDDEYVRCIACGNPLDEEYHAARGTDVTLTDDERTRFIHTLMELADAGGWLSVYIDHAIDHLAPEIEAIVAARVAKVTADLERVKQTMQMQDAANDALMDKYDALVEAMRAVRQKWADVRFYDVAAMQLRNSFVSDLDAALPPTGEPTPLLNNGHVWAEHGHPDQPCTPPEGVRGVVPCRAALPPTGEPTHEHEEWQVRDDGSGRYCAACGLALPPTGEPT